MATVAHSVRQPPQPFPWFWEFLKEELAPYPGRVATVSRMVISATIIMTICMTFRIPFGFQSAIFALLITRENPRATLQSSRTILLFSCLAAAYLLVSIWLVVSIPVLHFLWVLGSLFLAFYALSAMTNYLAASIIAIIISVGVPLWDRHVSAEANVEDTLRLLLAVSVGVGVTVAVELAFVHLKPGDYIARPIADRLSAVESLMACFAEAGCADQQIAKKVVSLTMVGTSLVRRILLRSNYSSEYSEQISGVIALVGRLVDMAATLSELRFEPTPADRDRLRNLAAAIANIRTALSNHRIPDSVQFQAGGETSRAVPLLNEMENIVALIPQAFVGARSIDDYLPQADDAPQSNVFAADALTNPDHIKFALKGCLAASGCYIIYNSVAWPGISTSVTTCLLTALSTIGASRQKQVMRLAGTVVGGFILGMGAQVFILPYVDTITGFILLFVLVTAPSAWIMTSSPRLSYFGLQLALAYYLIHLQEFARQISLSIARDRAVGVLLGLFLMWLVFDQLWSAPAGIEMKRDFIATFRLLAQLARAPVSGDIRVAIKQGFALRDAINAHFDRVRSLADGVLFEFGSRRQQDLALRDRIRRWQPQLRTLFLMRVASIKYRLRLPGFELTEAVLVAQQAYDDRSAQMLEEMADRMEGKPQQPAKILGDSLALLERTVQGCSSEASQKLPAARVESFETLLRRIDELTNYLSRDIGTEFGEGARNVAVNDP